MITVTGIYGRQMYDSWYAMSAIPATSSVVRDTVSSVSTRHFPAKHWQEAFAAARSGKCGKVVLDWS